MPHLDFFRCCKVGRLCSDFLMFCWFHSQAKWEWHSLWVLGPPWSFCPLSVSLKAFVLAKSCFARHPSWSWKHWTSTTSPISWLLVSHPGFSFILSNGEVNVWVRGLWTYLNSRPRGVCIFNREGSQCTTSLVHMPELWNVCEEDNVVGRTGVGIFQYQYKFVNWIFSWFSGLVSVG